jgi:hypothetical protein
MELAFFILGVCSFPLCTPGLYSGSGSFLYLGILSWCTRFEAWIFATAFNRNRYIRMVEYRLILRVQGPDRATPQAHPTLQMGAKIRDPYFCLHKNPILSIREGDWKLLPNPDRVRVELYNIPEDPMELTNHANFEENLVKQMSEHVMDWQATLPEGPIDDEAGSNAYPWPQTVVQP